MRSDCLLHRLFQGLVWSTEQARSARAGDKREAREGDDGNERRVRVGSDGKEKDRKAKVTSHFVPSHYSFRPRFP